MLKDFRGRVAYLQEDLIKGTMFGIAIDQSAQLFGVPEGRQRTVNEPDNLRLPVEALVIQMVVLLLLTAWFLRRKDV